MVWCLSMGAAAPTNATDVDVNPRAGQWFTQIGAVIINYDSRSEVRVAGAPAPGVKAIVQDDATLGAALGYYMTPNISAMLVLGRGPETEIRDASGTRLGKMWYGAPSLVFDYHFTNMGAFQPFIGVGGSYIWVLDETDGAISNLKIDSSLGLVLRAGTEIMLDRNIGVFFAANKIIVDTEAHGFVGGTPIEAKIDLDPWIYQGGLTYRF